eukprot:3941812-Rhodomonas_salina.3
MRPRGHWDQPHAMSGPDLALRARRAGATTRSRSLPGFPRPKRVGSDLRGVMALLALLRSGRKEPALPARAM